MSENHREPEVPEEKVPVVECLDGFARITSKELAITHFVKSGTLQNACSTRPRVVVELVEKCSLTHGQVDEQPTKRSKKNDDKSAVTMLKKENLQEREPVPDECHDRPEKPGKRSDKKLGQNSSKRRSSDARQLGCVFEDMTSSKSILQKCTDMPKAIQRVKFTKAVARHIKIRDQNPSLGYTCQCELHRRSPNAPNVKGSISRRDIVARARCPRGSVEAGQKCVQIKGAGKSTILLTFGKYVPACINS